MSIDFTGIGHAFVQSYYQMFDSDRKSVINMYKDQSMMTFEGQNFLGKQQILEKILALPFERTQHKVTQADCQPSGCGGILVQVVGEMIVTGETNALKFSQLFHLIPEGDNKSFWCHNDVFRLNYG